MDKKAQLQQALGSLSAAQVAALARGVETQRALGQETLPTETILAALRPQLRTGRPPRVPTLCRLACLSFEDFLTDRQDDPRPPGVISRAVIAPWWQGLQRIAEAEIRDLDEQLKRLVAANDTTGLAGFAEMTCRSARGWTEALLGKLRERRGDSKLKNLFLDAALIVDLGEIVRILTLGNALHNGIDAVIHVAALYGQAAGRHILDLTPEAVTEAKQQYIRITESFGLEARYFALALLNKLERPWQVLRLGRALSWKQNDSLVRDTEFGIIGERLIAELQVVTRELCMIAANKTASDLAALNAQITRYIDDSEGLLGEFGFRRDSAWGEAILQTRVAVAQAIGRDFLDTVADLILAVLPQTRRAGARRGGTGAPDLTIAPDEQIIARALEGSRFLIFLMHRGARHGFAGSAREACDQLAEEIQRRTTEIFSEVRSTPAPNPVVATQIDAAARVCDVLFEDERGELLTRKLRNAQAAPRGSAYGVSPGDS